MSFSRSIRLIRHLSSTAAPTPTPTTATNTSSISISKAKLKLKKEHDPDKALKILSSVSNHYKSPVSSRYAQELTIQRLSKARRFDDIESLIEAHKKDPKITQEPFLCTLIRSYGKAGMFNHALNTFNQMHELGTPRTTLSFNALLAACNNSKLFDVVPQLFDEMPKRYSLTPDKISFGILIKAYCEKGEPLLGLKIVEEMEEKGVEVTNVTFTTILDALYKKGMVDDAEKLWEVMVKKGGSVVDVAAYNVRIGYAHGGDPEDVKRLIEEMGGFGLRPDSISYNYLMTCYCRNGRMDDAIKVYQDLEVSGFRPKAAMFRTLIHYLCKNGDFERGYDVFKKSVFYNKIPDFATLKVLVEGLVVKNKKDAKGLIRTVKKKFPPNLLNAWKKVEVELGLVTQEASPDTPGEQEAAK